MMGSCHTNVKTHPTSNGDVANSKGDIVDYTRASSARSVLSYSATSSSSRSQRESWSRMGRDEPVIVDDEQPSLHSSRISTEPNMDATRYAARKKPTLSESSVESVDPSIEALRLIRDSLNYRPGDYNTVFIMGASVSLIFFFFFWCDINS